MNANPLCCLLCDHEHLVEADRRSAHEIKMIWEAMGIRFKDGAFPIGDGEASEYLLWRCGRCGFEFFDPATAGNALFYESLESPNYYTPNRPEFWQNGEFCSETQVEARAGCWVWCGLVSDMAREAGCQTYGLEFNPSAVLKSRSKGHRISGELLEKLPVDFCPQGFDLITLFQVLEHVTDPIGIIQNAVERLAPEGYLSLAVPSKNGIYRFLRADPAQWPPHHISWWSLDDFQTIAGRTGVQLVKSGGDLLLGTGILHAVKSHCLYESISCKKESAYHEGVMQMIALIYRKTGMKFIAPRWGNSIYAFLQKV